MNKARNNSEVKSSQLEKLGVNFEREILEKLDQLAAQKFEGNRSGAANYLLGAFLKKSP